MQELSTWTCRACCSRLSHRRRAVLHHVAMRAQAAAPAAGPAVIELAADYGRQVVVRYDDGHEDALPIRLDIGLAMAAILGCNAASKDHSHSPRTAHPKNPFNADNRLGLTGTLHRISAIRNRDNHVIGLTYRVGRHMPGMP